MHTRFLSLLLGLVVCLGGTSAVRGAEAPEAPEADQNQTQAERSAKQPKKAVFSGTVTGINSAQKTISIAVEKSATRTARVLPETEIKQTGKSIHLDQIRVGQHVTGMARVTDNGQYELLTLRVSAKNKSDQTKLKKFKKRTR